MILRKKLQKIVCLSYQYESNFVLEGVLKIVS